MGGRGGSSANQGQEEHENTYLEKESADERTDYSSHLAMAGKIDLLNQLMGLPFLAAQGVVSSVMCISKGKKNPHGTVGVEGAKP